MNGGDGSPSSEAELLEMRLRVEGLERDLEVTTGVLARYAAELHAMRHGRPERVIGRVERIHHLLRADALVAAGYLGAGPDGIRVPLAALQAGGPARAALRWRDAVTVDGVTLPGLLADPETIITYRLIGGPAAQVRTFVGILPAAWLQNRGGVRFRLSLIDATGATLAEVRRDVDPAARGADRRWLPLTVQIPQGAQGELRLELATSLPPAASPDYSWAVWGDPVLLVAPTCEDIEVLPSARASVGGALDVARRAIGRADPGQRHGGPTIGSGPTISLLLPVHDPSAELLQTTIDTVLGQDADGWQLCIADDGSQDPQVRALLDEVATDARVVLARNDRAEGVAAATNLALELATGEYVATLDHDDLLALDAIGTVRAHLAADPSMDVVYTDNDKVGAQGVHFAPSLKPDWSPDLLRACMYTLHLGVYRRSLVTAAGGWRPSFDGAQDHDLVLRLSERTTRISHLAKTLYSWRVHEGSAALGALAKPYAYDRGAAAVSEHLQRVGVSAVAERLPQAGRYRVVREPPPPASIGVVLPLPADIADIPGDDLAGRVSRVTAGLRSRGPAEMELILVTGSAMAASAAVAGSSARVITVENANWGALAAAGVAAATASFLVLLEELAAPMAIGWEAEVVGPLAEAGVAAVAPLVLDADGMVAGAGVALIDGLMFPVHPGANLDDDSISPELTMVTNRSAASGVVAVRRADVTGPALIDPAWRRAGLAQLTVALTADGRRLLCTPHARWQVDGPSRTAVCDLDEQRRVALQLRGRHDPFVNPRLWRDRASSVVPRSLRPAGRLGDIDRW